MPAFPADAIRAGAGRVAYPTRKRQTGPAIALILLSLVAAAAAAQLAQQTHVRFTPSGGFVIKSDGLSASRTIHSGAEIAKAASHLNFTAVLPAGLPPGTQPVRLFTSGNDLLAVTYDLPGAERRAHHMLWVFLANPDTFANAPRKRWAQQLQTGKHMLRANWRSGGEQVIVVSNGLTAAELVKMKAAMGASQDEPRAH